ncbi:aminotransferase-like domain-containing protein [Actinophytocola gossypii]|uniref:PLP-dependent aminotransferase family protein n=1 Tax=Actinophytocola gossypii TaxID=2812003 RepID=A0ABT2JH37_9PSEU|nr:PLP-dependent aminotransferase family protein [Actinophytocola gossypii]MCT2586819.1 PLP-dependent aminotransferase family protein [Actinophytocola gossypii]
MTGGPAADLTIDRLHGSLDDPAFESMNLLNEVSADFPDAISFAAGRPHEGFFDLDEVAGHVERFRDHLRRRFGGDETLVRRTLLQYGRTKGIIHDLVARSLAVDEKIDVDPEAVVVTVGCQEALYVTLRALRRDERDVLVVPRPCYVGVTGAAGLVEMPLVPVTETSAGIDPDEVARVVLAAKAAGRRPRALYVVADFANPTGASLDREARERLLDLAAEHDFLILEDNPYGVFHDGTERPPTFKALDRDRRVVYLGSFAKTGVAGARVGYVVADQRVSDGAGGTALLADQLAKIKSMLTVNTSPLAQAVIGGKLLANDYSLRAANERERRVYQRNLRQVLDGLAARFPAGSEPRVGWNVPAGGFFVVLDLPFPAGDELLRDCARTHGVLWTPMHHFHGQAEPLSRIRLSFSSLTSEQIEVGLDRLAAFVHARCAT